MLRAMSASGGGIGIGAEPGRIQVIAKVTRRVRHAWDRLRRRIAAAHPARRRAERSVATPKWVGALPETGLPVQRRFSAASPPPRAVAGTDVDVSVVIPVYNTESWLDDCLSSVLAQTGVSIEVVCVNDGSTDASRRILERYADADPRVRIIDQPNSGQSVGRNAGLDAARGRYVIYLDSDDFWVEDGLAALVRRAEEEDLEVLLFESVAFRDGDVGDDVWARYSTYYPRSRGYTRPRSGARMVADMRAHGDYRPHVGMYLARTSHVRDAKVRFIPGIVHQDNPYTFALLLNSSRVSLAKSFFYARRLRPGSTITTLRAAASAKGYLLSYLAMRSELDRHELDGPTSRAMQGLIAGVLESARKQVTRLPSAEREALGALDIGGEGRSVVAGLVAAPE